VVAVSFLKFEHLKFEHRKKQEKRKNFSSIKVLQQGNYI
jgi:hypothetical protein